MTNNHFILNGKKIKKVPLMVWAKWIETHRKEKILKQTRLWNGKWVSTVFLGIDYNFSLSGRPILFETMVFPAPGNYREIDMNRYRTYEEAIKGHELMVKKWRIPFYQYFSRWLIFLLRLIINKA